MNPELARLIERLEAEERPSSMDLPLGAGRRNFEDFVADLGTYDGNIRTSDSVIVTEGGPLEVRVYVPAGQACGTVVYLHGGGWVFGSLDSHDGLCRGLADAAEARVVAVAYRLAPEHPFPAPVDDALAAVAWAAGDEPLAVAGDSAGAALALSVALRARDDGAPVLAALMLLYPPTTPGGLGGAEPGGPTSVFLTRREMDWYWDRYLQTERARTDPSAVPALASLRDLPPTVVVVAGLDPLHPEGVDLARRLAEDGVDVRLRDYADMVHGFVLFTRELTAGRDALATLGADLRELLRRDSGGR